MSGQTCRTKNGSAIEQFLVIKLAAPVFELPDQWCLKRAILAACIVEAPLAGLSISIAGSTLNPACSPARASLSFFFNFESI
jgi:hypothetical protein